MLYPVLTAFAALSGGIGWYFQKSGDPGKYLFFVVVTTIFMMISTIDAFFAESLNIFIALLQTVITIVLILVVIANFKHRTEEVAHANTN